LLAGAGSTVLFSGFFFVLWTAWASGHEKVAPDPRVSVVVFPFNSSGTETAGYGEGLADLLVTTLDGTPGIRIADPSSLWRGLRPERGALARGPELDEALRLSRKAGARRFVTGTVVPLGSNLEMTARVYDATSGDVLGSFNASAHEDSVSGAVNRLAIDLVASIWEREQLPNVPEIERFATSNADALKAYLEAVSLVRRDFPDQAEPVIERAVSLDSTFALAHLAHFNIRSRTLWLNSQPYTGIRPIIERAMRYRDRLTPRNRLRIEAARALDDTDAVRAAFLLERILSIDSLDVDALGALALTHIMHGWQLKKSGDEITAQYDRLLSRDPESVIARASRARLALVAEDSLEVGRQLANLVNVDTTSAYIAGVIGALRALTAQGPAKDTVLRSLAGAPIPVVFTAFREIRAYSPETVERYANHLMNEPASVTHNAVGSQGRLGIWLAAGRLAGIDSLLGLGEFDQWVMPINRRYVVARLAGVGDPDLASHAIETLTDHVPADSLSYYHGTRPAWITGWTIGAYHATFGEASESPTWQRALEKLPGGGTLLDYRAALSADIEARLAMRRGDLETAEQQARRALENWQVHSNNVSDDWPELAMRFHMAEVLRAKGAPAQAEWYYRSLIPPHGWAAPFVARSSFELGQIEEARGNRDEAFRHYLRALRLWELGEPDVVGEWLVRTQEGMRRLGGERRG
jgi:tetratricopeptide (TPR) repeat protein